ncbi:MAG TPA: acyltransferase family protein, partial [Variovorax sp.]|nr:acyltransferase family protein [Variovorax sp.]
GNGRRALQIVVEHPDAMAWPDLLVSALLNAAMLPSPLTHELTPLNVVTWSLQLELLINAVWATLLVRMSRRTLLALWVALAAMLVAMVVARGSSAGGAEWKDLHMGAVRGFFGFVTGMVLAGSLVPRMPRESGLAPLAVILLIGLLVVDVAPDHRPVHDLLSIFVCFPFLMVLALSFDPPRRLRGVARFLGDISFPVYTLHFGVLYGFLYLARKLGFDAGAGAGSGWIPAFIAVVVGLSIVLARTCDLAARGCLRRWMVERRARLAPTT